MKLLLLTILSRLVRLWWRATGSRLAYYSSRTTDWEPSVCHHCGYVARTKDFLHDYETCGAGDVEPVDFCPRCYEEA